MRQFVFQVGDRCSNAPIDFGPCKIGSSVTASVQFMSRLPTSIQVKLANIPQCVTVSARQFVLSSSSKFDIRFTWTSGEAKFQLLNASISVIVSKMTQTLVLLGLATEKELNIFHSSMNERLYERISLRPITFFLHTPIGINKPRDTFIPGGDQEETDGLELLSHRDVYDRLMDRTSTLLNRFTNSLLHTSYVLGYELFSPEFVERRLPVILNEAYRRYSEAIPAIYKKVGFRHDLAGPSDQKCRDTLVPGFISIDGAVFRLVCASLYKFTPNLAELLGFVPLHTSTTTLEVPQEEIAKQLFYDGLPKVSNRTLTNEDRKQNKDANIRFFIRILTFLDLCVTVHQASGIHRPLQRSITLVQKTKNNRVTRSFTEFFNSYYSIVGTTGCLSTLLHGFGFTWFNPDEDEPRMITHAMPPILTANIANFRSLLPHCLLHMTHGRGYDTSALILPTNNYDDILHNMRVFLLFVWQHRLTLDPYGTRLVHLTSLSPTNLKKVVVSLIKENQMTGLLCSEKLLLSSVNGKLPGSVIDLCCQNILAKLKFLFDQDVSPVVVSIDRMYERIRQRLRMQRASLDSLHALDSLLQGQQVSTGGAPRPCTLLTVLELHLENENHTEFLLLALQMLALLHGCDLMNMIFELNDCMNSGILLLFIIRTILPEGLKDVPGSSLFSFESNLDLEDSSDIHVSDLQAWSQGSLGPNSSAHRPSVMRTRTSGAQRMTLSDILRKCSEADVLQKPMLIPHQYSFVECHALFLTTVSRHREALEAWDYPLAQEIFCDQNRLLDVQPVFHYFDEKVSQTRYFFSLFRFVDAYTRSMGSEIPNTTIITYYISMLVVATVVSLKASTLEHFRANLLHVCSEEDRFRRFLGRFGEQMEEYRAHEQIDQGILLIQAVARRFLARRSFVRIKLAALIIQHNWRISLYGAHRYLNGEMARRNLFERDLLLGRRHRDPLSSVGGRQVLLAAVRIQRHYRAQRLSEVAVDIRLYVQTKRAMSEYLYIFDGALQIQRAARLRLLRRFASLASSVALPWTDLRRMLPTALLGVPASVGIRVTLSMTIRALHRTLQVQRLAVARIVSIYRGYHVRSSIRRMLSALLLEGSYAERRRFLAAITPYIRFHPVEIVKLLISRNISEQDKDYVLTTFATEAELVLRHVTSIQTRVRAWGQRVRFGICCTLVNAVIPNVDGGEEMPFKRSLLRRAVQRLFEPATPQTLADLIPYLQKTILRDALSVLAIQGAARGYRIRTLLSHVRRAANNDFILVRLAVLNNFNFQAVLDAASVIVLYLCTRRQRICFKEALKRWDPIVQTYLIGNEAFGRVYTANGVHEAESRLLAAACCLQAWERGSILRANVKSACALLPLLLRYDIVCFGLYFMPNSFRDVVLPATVSVVVEIQYAARRYLGRRRLRLLKAFLQELAAAVPSSWTIDKTVLAFLPNCTLSEQFASIHPLLKSVVLIQAMMRMRTARLRYTRVLIPAVVRIQAAFRGYVDREVLRIVLGGGGVMKEFFLSSPSSRQNITLWRRKLVEQDAQIMISANARGFIVRKRMLYARRKALTHIIFQVLWRNIGRKTLYAPMLLVTDQVYELIRGAACSIQTIARGVATRKVLQIIPKEVLKLLEVKGLTQVSAALAQADRIIQAAKTLQAYARGYLYRKKYSFLRAAHLIYPCHVGQLLSGKRLETLTFDGLMDQLASFDRGVSCIKQAIAHALLRRNTRAFVLLKDSYPVLRQLSSAFVLFALAGDDPLDLLRLRSFALLKLKDFAHNLDLIQAIVLGYIIRLSYRKIRHSPDLGNVVIRILGASIMYRPYSFIRTARKMEGGALLLQSRARGIRTRAMIFIRDQELSGAGLSGDPVLRKLLVLNQQARMGDYLSAALTIQAHYRGLCVRRNLGRVPMELLTLLPAGCDLIHAFMLDKQVHVILEAVISIQRAARAHLLFSRKAALKHAAAVLGVLPEDALRLLGSNTRTFELTTRSRTLLQRVARIQAGARGYNVRTSFFLGKELVSRGAVLPTLGLKYSCYLAADNRGVEISRLFQIPTAILNGLVEIDGAGTIIAGALSGWHVRHSLAPLRALDRSLASLILESTESSLSRGNILLRLSAIESAASIIQRAFRCFSARRTRYLIRAVAERDSVYGSLLLNHRLKAPIPWPPVPAQTIQYMIRRRSRSLHQEKASAFGTWNFSDEELLSDKAFERRKRLLQTAATRIQYEYYVYRMHLTLRQLSDGDERVSAYIVAQAVLQLSSLPLDDLPGQHTRALMRFFAHRALPPYLLLDSFDNLLSIVKRVQAWVRGLRTRRAYSLLEELVGWGIPASLLIKPGRELPTAEEITLVAGDIYKSAIRIQAAFRGAMVRLAGRHCPKKYQGIVPDHVLRAGDVQVQEYCTRIDYAQTILAAAARGFLVRRRFWMLHSVSGFPEPDRMVSVLISARMFWAQYRLASAALTVQRIARSKLTRISLSAAVPLGVHWYLPQALMSSPTNCFLLSQLLTDSTITLQTYIRGYLTRRSVAYVRQKLTPQTAILLPKGINYCSYLEVCVAVTAIIRATHVIQLQGRRYLAGITREILAKAGVGPTISKGISPTHPTKVAAELDRLLRALCVIQGAVRKYLGRRIDNTILEALEPFGLQHDTAMAQLVHALDSSKSIPDTVRRISCAAIVIQKYYRGYEIYKKASLCRAHGIRYTRHVPSVLRCTVLLQAQFRGALVRKALRQRAEERGPGDVSIKDITPPLQTSSTERAVCTIQQYARGFLVRRQIGSLLRLFESITNLHTMLRSKAAIPPLTSYRILKNAVNDVRVCLAALSIQSALRSRKTFRDLPSAPQRKLSGINKRLRVSMASVDKTKTLGKQLLVHRAILYKADYPHTNPRSIVKLNGYCALYSPSILYIFSRDFCETVASVIRNTITTPIIQHYAIFHDACELLYRMLAYNRFTYSFDGQDMTNLNVAILPSPAKILNAQTQAYTSELIDRRLPILELPDVLIQAIEFHKKNEEARTVAVRLLQFLLQHLGETIYQVLIEKDSLERLVAEGIVIV
ncbi:IQ calmodulin-binding motif-containing protein [Giardia muris]|uniref:IQ calmodulin-binding motif-containing protein n=1 Tax=Giardia muris TaxID=5742 RepID=A0A4Z1SUU3_GIAMU|nr:IQ calmodulin-binding motif-containing protein [Giardia muris]|eukprot:TNJ29584.1 IQ calmodulin-binding motif-containing protein [Giardia muris]